MSDIQASILLVDAPADDPDSEFRRLGRKSRRFEASRLAVTIEKNAADFARLGESEPAHAGVILTDRPVRLPAGSMRRLLCMDRARGRCE